MRNISMMINTTRYICTCCSVRWIYDHESFPGGSDGKESACNVWDLGSIPGLGRSPGEGNSYPLQYSGLENSKDRGVCQATVCGSRRIRHDWATFTYDHELRKLSKLLKDHDPVNVPLNCCDTNHCVLLKVTIQFFGLYIWVLLRKMKNSNKLLFYFNHRYRISDLFLSINANCKFEILYGTGLMLKLKASIVLMQ